MIVNEKLTAISYYDDCQMAEMQNKNIFKEELSNVSRKEYLSSFLDHLQQEELFKDGISYVANLYGCSNFFIEFTIRFEKEYYSKEFVLETFNFLIKSTRFSSIIKK